MNVTTSDKFYTLVERLTFNKLLADKGLRSTTVNVTLTLEELQTVLKRVMTQERPSWEEDALKMAQRSGFKRTRQNPYSGNASYPEKLRKAVVSAYRRDPKRNASAVAREFGVTYQTVLRWHRKEP